jgi:oxygen-independent coproporphyrinogen-3 oxidase
MNGMDRETMNFNKQTRELGIYIHIPFCVKKCAYCDFLSAPATEEMKQEYINALLTEIKSYSGNTKEYIVPNIFFGGGTPSCISADAVLSIMEAIREVFAVDIERLEATIEVNPGTVTRDKLEQYKNAGINRLSFGLQSTNDEELKLLGRIHTFEQFLENYHLARELGFHNINIDLMSALPGQTLSSWENTLETVLKLKPEHISAYSLIIEEGTQFYDLYRPGTKGAAELPDEDTDRLMYQRTKEILELNGYRRYEISNYAKPGFECRHNSSYWIGTDYLGVGLGASSLLYSMQIRKSCTIKQT